MHVPDPDIAVGIPVPGNGDQSRRGVDTRAVAPRSRASSMANPDPQATSSRRSPASTPSWWWRATYSRQLLGSLKVEKSTALRPQPSSTIVQSGESALVPDMTILLASKSTVRAAANQVDVRGRRPRSGRSAISRTSDVTGSRNQAISASGSPSKTIPSEQRLGSLDQADGPGAADAETEVDVVTGVGVRRGAARHRPGDVALGAARLAAPLSDRRGRWPRWPSSAGSSSRSGCRSR